MYTNEQQERIWVREADISSGMRKNQGDRSRENNYGCDRRSVEEHLEEVSAVPTRRPVRLWLGEERSG